MLSRNDAAWPDGGLLTRSEILGRSWRFERSDGSVISLVVQFLPNGQIANWDHFNERRWTFEDGALLLHAEDGTVSTRFTTRREENGRPFLLGNYLLSPEPEIGLHVLRGELPYQTHLAPGLAPLHVEMSLARPGRPLLAIFNGRGQLFDGERTAFEFYHLPGRLGLDPIRFAEREGRVAWYVDKTSLVLGHLGHALSAGYRRVVLCGMSAGGYASILFAERLAATHPDIEFRTVAINPQIVLGADHRAHLTGSVEGRWLPPQIEDEALANADCDVYELPRLVRRASGSRANVRHVVLYDSGNPAEEYHISLLAGLKGFDIRPCDLRMSHVRGVIRIYESEIFRRALEETAFGGSAVAGE